MESVVLLERPALPAKEGAAKEGGAKEEGKPEGLRGREQCFD